MSCTSPFFYIIKHKLSRKLYAGYCSSHKHCNSSKFMTEYGYKTSSKYVKELINKDGLTSFEIIRIRHFPTSCDAINYESRFLHKINAMHNNIFINQNNGGKEFRCKGHTKESRDKMGLSRKGLTHSDETKIKMSISSKKRFEENPVTDKTKKLLSIAMKGKITSDETKMKISIACKGRVTSDETKNKLSIKRKGKRGHSQTQDTRKKLAEAGRKRKGEKRSSITKQRISEKCTGLRWWNDGSSVKRSVDCPGEGWSLGRMKAYGCAARN